MKAAELLEQVRERRRHRKQVYIGEDWLRRLINVPDDVHIERIDYDQYRQTFVLILSHNDWPIVPDYCEPPSIIGTMTAAKIKAKTFEGVEIETIQMHLELDWED